MRGSLIIFNLLVPPPTWATPHPQPPPLLQRSPSGPPPPLSLSLFLLQVCTFSLVLHLSEFVHPKGDCKRVKLKSSKIIFRLDTIPKFNINGVVGEDWGWESPRDLMAFFIYLFFPILKNECKDMWHFMNGQRNQWCEINFGE